MNLMGRLVITVIILLLLLLACGRPTAVWINCPGTDEDRYFCTNCRIYEKRTENETTYFKVRFDSGKIDEDSVTSECDVQQVPW